MLVCLWRVNKAISTRDHKIVLQYMECLRAILNQFYTRTDYMNYKINNFWGIFQNGPFWKLLMLLSVHLTLSHPILSLGRICFWRNIEYWNIVTYHIRCYLWGESVIGSTEYWILRYCNISHQMLSIRRIRSWLDGYLSWTRGWPRRALWKMAEEKIFMRQYLSFRKTILLLKGYWSAW